MNSPRTASWGLVYHQHFTISLVKSDQKYMYIHREVIVVCTDYNVKARHYCRENGDKEQFMYLDNGAVKGIV